MLHLWTSNGEIRFESVERYVQSLFHLCGLEQDKYDDGSKVKEPKYSAEWNCH